MGRIHTPQVRSEKEHSLRRHQKIEQRKKKNRQRCYLISSAERRRSRCTSHSCGSPHYASKQEAHTTSPQDDRTALSSFRCIFPYIPCSYCTTRNGSIP